jgi:hypothetical protein
MPRRFYEHGGGTASLDRMDNTSRKTEAGLLAFKGYQPTLVGVCLSVNPS